jgi:hypothetical protein
VSLPPITQVPLGPISGVSPLNVASQSAEVPLKPFSCAISKADLPLRAPAPTRESSTYFLDKI